MRFTWLLLALVQVPRPTAETPLFNGKDLEGWVAEGVSQFERDGKTQPVWSVSEGVLKCTGKGFGFLRYGRREYGDFAFHVEFRMAPRANTGIGIRTGPFDPLRSRATRPSFYSYEIQLIDDAGKPPTTHSSGSLYRYVAPRRNAMRPAGEWNEIDIECVGPKIRITLNGERIIDQDQRDVEALRSKPLRGHVCLQNHGGNVEFRSVRIRDLSAGTPE
ncbi:MAG: DUF1080 domain-containing protein [Isosphaeraceae bacterium]